MTHYTLQTTELVSAIRVKGNIYTVTRKYLKVGHGQNGATTNVDTCIRYINKAGAVCYRIKY